MWCRRRQYTTTRVDTMQLLQRVLRPWLPLRIIITLILGSSIHLLLETVHMESMAILTVAPLSSTPGPHLSSQHQEDCTIITIQPSPIHTITTITIHTLASEASPSFTGTTLTTSTDKAVPCCSHQLPRCNKLTTQPTQPRTANQPTLSTRVAEMVVMLLTLAQL